MPVDSAEFERLYRAYHPWLVQYCRRRLNGHGDAEAIAQEAFVRAWVTADRYQGARFQGWVATIAGRLCVSTFRRAAIERQYQRVVAAPTEPLSPEAVVEQREEADVARRALALLPSGYQRLITLRDLDGWSYEDIARAEDLSVEAVRGRLRRARVSLRQAYARLAPPGVPAVVRWCRSLRNRLAAPGFGFDRLLIPWAQLARPVELTAVVAAALAVAGAPSIVAPERAPAAASMALASHEERAKTEAVAPAPTADRPAPKSPGPHATLGVVLPLLQPEPADDEVDETAFEAFTPSPNYADDGTVFATGPPEKLCVVAACNALFRSTDRGHTWQRLPAVGYVNGFIHLPPDYPADPRIFAFRTGVLSVSHDGGLSFVPIGHTVAWSNGAAVSPDFTNDGLILLGQRYVEYRDRLQAVVPVSSMRSGSDSFLPLFSPGYRSDRTVFELSGKLDRCVAEVCATVATFPNPVALAVVSPRHAGTGRVAAAEDRSVYVSVTGDGDYRAATALPIEGSVTDLAYDHADRLFVSTLTYGFPSRGGVAVSDDDGRTWRVLGKGTPLERGVWVVHPLPDGRILAALSWHQGGGLWCSVDDGVTWHPRCAA